MLNQSEKSLLIGILGLAWPSIIIYVYAEYDRSLWLVGLMTMIPFGALLIAWRVEVKWLSMAQSVGGEIVDMERWKGKRGYHYVYQIAHEFDGVPYWHQYETSETLQVGDLVALLTDPADPNRVRTKKEKWSGLYGFMV